nr:endonuclease MutS2 [uncultured Intestinibacter sp.]
MNNTTLDKLQLNDLKELVKIYCVSSLGKELIDNIKPKTSIYSVDTMLKENKEARNILENSNHIPLEGVFNLNSLIDKVEKGIILNPEELMKTEAFLRGCKKIKNFMENMRFYGETLSSYSLNITDLTSIEEEINFCIKANKIDTNASSELKKIRRKIENCESKIKDKLNIFLTSSSNKKYIQEFLISKRDDRYVIPIKASYKHEVNGVVLDTSSKGNTVFIEPDSVSKFSTELISLKAEESIEEYRILSYLTELIFDKIQEIRINTEVIANYDMIFAKAKYSLNHNCITPNINNHGYIKLVKAKHPLLKGNIVPLDFEIGDKYRSLIITGPNAGGKTVTLKTVGILTLMTQCGFDIPAEEGTSISIFENIFVDIGDNQSIENALSTFSSHIQNIASIINKSNKSTLVLLDEIGSGTEPNEGAALAIAILDELYQMGCITIASTHYGELKKFATMHPDFENAGMMFNKNTLEPLYKLTIGHSQNSNALFISKKMGIRDKVLKKANNYINNKDYEINLIDSRKIRNEEKIDNTIQTYDYEIGDKIRLLDKDDFGIVYTGIDKFNNLQVLYKDEFITVNVKRTKPYLKAKDLYPEGYDLNSLFVSFKDRKLEKDIARGSKNALKKIQKEIKNASH